MRITNSPASRKRRNRMLQAAKGFRLKRSKLYRYASDAVDHGRQYAYRDRRVKKRTFRYLWQVRINAAAGCAGRRSCTRPTPTASPKACLSAIAAKQL